MSVRIEVTVDLEPDEYVTITDKDRKGLITKMVFTHYNSEWDGNKFRLSGDTKAYRIKNDGSVSESATVWFNNSSITVPAKVRQRAVNQMQSELGDVQQALTTLFAEATREREVHGS